ncbi:MAG: hypothetical protein JTT11_05370 [Candidatus Brockarchaeota archaeon]|nr:hypothetical protein [Candidatus Brockarchaeota archaeon]
MAYYVFQRRLFTETSMPLAEVIGALLRATRLKAKYVGELPPGVREVMRETFESFSITFDGELDQEAMKLICSSKGFAVMEKESREEEVYDQFGNLIEKRVVEWKYPFRIVDSDGEIVLFADPSDPSKVYFLPLAAGQKSIRIRGEVVSAIEEYVEKRR